MNKMDLFETEDSGFKEAFEQFALSLGYGCNVNIRYNKFDGYFKELYRQGALNHTPALDKLVRSCYFRDAETLRLSQKGLDCEVKLLQHGLPLELLDELRDFSSEMLTELASLDLYTTEYDEWHFVIELARKAYCGKEQHAEGIYFDNWKVLPDGEKYNLQNLSKLINQTGTKALVLEDWDIVDIINASRLLKDGHSMVQALDVIGCTRGKLYPYSVLQSLLIVECSLKSLPQYKDTLGLFLQMELKEGVPVEEIVNHYEAFSRDRKITMEEHFSYIRELLLTGYTFNRLEQLGVSDVVSYMWGILDEMKHVELARFEKSHEVSFDTVKLMDCIRFSLNSKEEKNVLCDHVIYSVKKFLVPYEILAGSCWLQSNDMYYDEIQIVLDGNLMYHFPADFFMQYRETLESWAEELPIKVCALGYTRDHESSIRQLDIYLATTQHVRIHNFNRYLGKYSIDYEQAFRLIHSYPEISSSSGILKIALHDYLKSNGLNTELLAEADLQTVVAMTQALIMQDTPEYKAACRRTDLFIPGFSAMKWVIRHDDNLYSAILRYALSIADVDSYLTDTKISQTLTEVAVVCNKRVSLLDALRKNSVIIQYLREHPTAHIYIREDVVIIE